MRFAKSWTLTAASFALCSGVLLAYSADGMAAARKVDSLEIKLDNPSPFKVRKLETGLELITLESRKVPLVTLVLAVKAGAMTETPETNGLTHLWEHMFFKGNATLPNQEAFNQRIRQLGMDYNGDTSAEVVRYYFTMPSVFLEEGIKFMYDAIATPLLEQSELEREVQVVLDEYDRAASQPEFDAYRLVQHMIYDKLAYRRDPLGQRPVIAATTRDQLLKIKDEVFVPSNSALLISGDFDAATVEKLVTKYFNKWVNPKDWKPLTLPTFPKFPKTNDFVMVRPLVQNVRISYTFEGPTSASPEDTFAADVLISLLNARSGRFYKRLVDSGLTLGAGLSYPTQRYAGQLTVYALASPENVSEVRRLLLEETRSWAKDSYFTQEQLDDVRRSLLIDHKRQLNSPSSYIKSLAFWWAVAGLDYYSSYLENLSKTSLRDIAAFSKKYFHDKPYIKSIVLSPEDAKAAKLPDTSKPLFDRYLSSQTSEGGTTDAKAE